MSGTTAPACVAPVPFRVRLESVGKRFRISQRTARGRTDAGAEVWALREVSFDVPPGTVTALVGQAGAGRTTLLRVLAGVTRQTEGDVVGYGRRASLLELSRHVDRDMTARASLVARPFWRAVPGGAPALANRAELAAVAEQAGVQHLLRGRLDAASRDDVEALVHAAVLHGAPDLLVADDRLFVGSEAYQEAARARLLALIEAGTSVVVRLRGLRETVSLADHVVWLEGGRVRRSGPAHDVVEEFRLTSSPRRPPPAPAARRLPASASVAVTVLRKGQERSTITRGDSFVVDVRIEAPDATARTAHLGIDVYREDLLVARAGVSTALEELPVHRVSAEVDSSLLVPGVHRAVVRVALEAGDEVREAESHVDFAIRTRDGQPAPPVTSFPFAPVRWGKLRSEEADDAEVSP